MKNFKKSLLVVPALGVLMLAAAGSVGGTVAWFSSVSTFQTNISSFAVGRVAGNLDVTMAAGRGTHKVGDAIVVGESTTTDVKLTHGSFIHTTAEVGNSSVYTITNQAVSASGTFISTRGGTVSIDKSKFLYASKQIAGTYTFTFDGTNWDLAAAGDVVASADITPALLTSTWGLTLTGEAEADDTIVITLVNTYALDADWKYNTTPLAGVYWYYAVSWSMTFTYDFGTDTTARNVYFDTTSTVVSTQLVAGTGSELTKKGFRIAFHDGTTRNVIWAPEQTTRTDIRYVSGTSAVSSYTDSENVSLLYSGIAAGEIASNEVTSAGQATASTNKNYLCQLTSGSATKTIYCVAWFEGTDPNIVNRAEMDSIAASLKFFAVSHAA